MSDTVKKNLGIVTAYGYARSKGYEGTEEEFAELMASYAEVAEDAAQSASEAAQSATNAAGSATAASGSAVSAANSATSASGSAQDAETAQAAAQQSATAAAGSATSASGSATAASGSAAQAVQSATSAAGSATSAQSYSSTAASAAQAASGSADDADTSATAAAASAAAAAESARTLTIDDTLTQQGQAADSKKTGDEISAIKADLTELDDKLDDIVADTIEVTTGKNLCPPNLTDGYIKPDGTIAISGDWGTTEYIDVSSLTAVTFSAKGRNSGSRATVTMFFLTTYDANKTRIEQVSNPGTTYTVENNVQYIRFSVHKDIWTDLMLEAGTSQTGYQPYEITYKAVNNEYALQTDLNETNANLNELNTAFSDILVKDYQLYSPSFSESPSAIWNNGTLITTLADTKTTTYIDCSTWIGIRYNGASWLGARALAFYDENQAWISSIPIEGQTTYYTDEDIKIPADAKYVVFADLTRKVTQTLRIEIATNYKTVGKWSGKKWTCVGDSLTESNLRTTMNYHDYVAQSTGIAVVNMGKSGTGYKRTYDEGFAFYQRISNVPTDSDVVTIFGSGNDLTYISDLGTPSDSGADTNPTTICGCINKTIDTLIALIPTVQLGIVAPTPWVGQQPTLNNSNSMGQYVEALRQICYIRSIPFLDLYHESNLRPWTEEGRNACYSKDEGNGVHPDETGHRIIASRFEGFLDSLLLGN